MTKKFITCEDEFDRSRHGYSSVRTITILKKVGLQPNNSTVDANLFVELIVCLRPYTVLFVFQLNFVLLCKKPKSMICCFSATMVYFGKS